jgi:hypothetical protein
MSPEITASSVNKQPRKLFFVHTHLNTFAFEFFLNSRVNLRLICSRIKSNENNSLGSQQNRRATIKIVPITYI